MKARLVDTATDQVIQEFDLTESVDASGEGWENGTGNVRYLECAGPVIPDEIKSIPGETLTYEGRPIPYKFNGISGYISVEITGKCLFFYVFDGDVMYDEIGEFSANQK